MKKIPEQFQNHQKKFWRSILFQELSQNQKNSRTIQGIQGFREPVATLLRFLGPITTN